MSQSIAIARTDLGSLIKVAKHDHEDFQITVTGSVPFPTIFASVSGGVQRALDRGAELNNLTIVEMIFQPASMH